MNKHDKTRYVFAQAIKGLIKVHPLDKIAVTDIVTRSGMTRQTFYRYFNKKSISAVTDCPKFFSMMFL